ncbi:UbiA prenyltransferase family protein [Allosalinactinospora lopnorensis]|uniref:hypothetical protein n=1 Tax=Allosalinactinospora lopnorensis TaxID=1352348 RepID=UPI000623CCB1|nr:hypothetical protein [Allosalinactinospora lopnorensis]
MGEAVRRFAAFAGETFPARIYLTYAALWSLALEGSLALLSGGTGPVVGADTALRALTVWLVLLFLRIVDEQKDLDYDRVHHPERPLVRGSISTAELRRAMAVIAGAVLAANIPVSSLGTAVLALDLAYALLLIHLERHSPRVRDGVFRNLAVTYPVQLLLSCYLAVSFLDSRATAAGWAVAPLLAVFAFAFLHFEFARKTAWDRTDQRLYSNVAGPVASGLLAAGSAAYAAATALALFRPWTFTGAAAVAGWLPYTALLLAGLGAWTFGSRGRRTWNKGLAMGFLVVFYTGLVVQAAAATRLLPGWWG